MRHLPLSLFVFILGLGFGSVVRADADADFAAYEKLAMEGPPQGLTRAQYYEWHMTRYARVMEASEALMKNYPHDPRRWRAANVLHVSSRFIQDMVSRQQKKALEWRAQGLQAKDIADVDWRRLKGDEVTDLTIVLMQEAYSPAAKPALSEARRALDELTRRFPDTDTLPMNEFAYAELLKKQDPQLGRLWLRHLADTSPNREIATRAAGMVRFAKLRETPVDMKFTALDGRKVDLAKLRGKVVLVDFWATWCGPCVAEMPNVQAVHEKYRQQGFEVVGITLDGKGDRKKVEDFVRKRNIPWPQFLDEKNEKNSLAEHYGIAEIPAALLFGKDGMLASDQARGEALEPAVKRLLDGAEARQSTHANPTATW